MEVVIKREYNMGGCCCCCSSKGPEPNSEPAYYVYPVATGEHSPFSSWRGAVPTTSMGLLVDTNLDTSTPDAYRSPPPPLPFDVALGHPETGQGPQDSCLDKNGDGQTMNSCSTEEIVDVSAQETSSNCENLKEWDCKKKTDKELDSTKELEVEPAKVEEEDVCPICLEEYDEENPKISMKCEHHFHLACILEWIERSEICPVCDKVMVFDPPIDY